MMMIHRGGDDVKDPGKTHDEEQLSHRDKLGSEEFIDGSLRQSSHLPPVREERGSSPDEADEVDDDDEDDDEVVVKKLGSFMKRNFWVIFWSNPTVKHSHIW